MTERIELLIEGAIDGTNSAADTQELMDAATRDADVREHLNNARLAARLVAMQPVVDAPAGFADRVLAALPARVSWEPVSRSTHYAVRPARPARQKWMLGFGMTAVLASIFIIFMTVDLDSDSESLKATMISPDYAITAGSERVSVSVRQVMDDVILHVINGHSAEVTIEIRPSWAVEPWPTMIVEADGMTQHSLKIGAVDSGTITVIGHLDNEILFEDTLNVQQ